MSEVLNYYKISHYEPYDGSGFTAKLTVKGKKRFCCIQEIHCCLIKKMSFLTSYIQQGASEFLKKIFKL